MSDMCAGTITTDWYLRLKREGWWGELTLVTAQARSCDFTLGMGSDEDVAPNEMRVEKCL